MTVDARATGTEVPSGVFLQDETDTPRTAFVSAGGISLTASQVPTTLLPRARNALLYSLTVTNHYPEGRTLRSLQLQNGTLGPGDEDQLDAELGELSLYRDLDGDGTLTPGDESIVSTVALSDAAIFTPFLTPIPAGGTIRFLVLAALPLHARDGDALDLSIVDSTSLEFDRSIFYRTGWPLAPAGSFLIDGMAAEQIAVEEVPSTNLLAGSSNNLAFRIVVPGNGYQTDVLQRLAVVNSGTAEPGTDLERIRVWKDDGDRAFDPDTDSPLGDLVFTGDRWQRTGLAEAIPLEGLRLFFTVDVSDLARQGRTVQLAVPFGLDAGLGVQSGNSGPRDRLVRNSAVSAVSTVDRITLTSATVDSTSIRPGERGVTLHHLIVTNSYSGPRTLTALAFTNVTQGLGTVAERDGEIEAATLRLDGNGDGVLGTLSEDPALGTSFFSGGRAVFTGLSTTVPAGATAHLFFTADVSRSSARDGDALSAWLESPDDISFLEGTTITAAWPVDSRARAVVNGMIASQITNLGAPGVTLGPADGPTLALNVVVPGNGYARDLLRSLWVVNVGTATGSTGIAELRLWADGGDGIFSAGGGDDRDLNALTFDGGVWKSLSLADTLYPAGQRLFVSLRTSADPEDSVTVRLRIPFGGITVESGNDGPIDATIENPQTILISTSPLLATIETGTAASTIGQAIEVRMIVRNAGTETVLSIEPTLQVASGTAGVVLDSGPVPPLFDLASAETDTFTWTYHSTGSGEVQFSGDARGTGQPSGLVRRAVPAVSNVHRVYLAAADLALFPVQSMPFNVTRGQADVVPFSLTLTNGGGAGASTSGFVRLDPPGGRERHGHHPFEPPDWCGGERGDQRVSHAVFPRDVRSRGRSHPRLPTARHRPGAGHDQRPAGSLRLHDHARIPRGAAGQHDVPRRGRDERRPRDRPAGRRRLPGALGAHASRGGCHGGPRDRSARESSPRRHRHGGRDPRSGSTRESGPRRNHVGRPGGSDRSHGGRFCGTPVPRAASWLSRIVLRTASQTFTSRAVQADESASLTLVLSPPLSVAAGTPADLMVAGDIADTARVGTFRILLQPPGSIEARDAISRDSVAVTYARTRSAAPSSAWRERQRRSACGAPRCFHPRFRQVNGTCRRPSWRCGILVDREPAGSASTVCSSRSATRRGRSRRRHLSRPAPVLLQGVEVANLTSLPPVGGTIPVALGGSNIDPGDTVRITLIVDISRRPRPHSWRSRSAAPGLIAADANTGHVVRVEPEAGTDLPLVSGLTRITAPSRDLLAGLQSRIPASLADRRAGGNRGAPHGPECGSLGLGTDPC